MTYAEFSTAVRQAVFPDGEPENLIDRHKNYLLDAVIKIQQRVAYWQQRHTEIIPFEQTLWNCGATAFSAPRGFIKSCSTVNSSDYCGRIYLDPISHEEMKRIMRDQQDCGCSIDEPYGYYEAAGVYVPFGTLPLGFAYAEDDTDKSCRATSGQYTLKDCQIWVWPNIQSTESIILEWDGLKRSFSDSDTVDFDREFTEAAELYVESQAAKHDDKDHETANGIMAEFNDKIGDMIWQHKAEQRLPQPAYQFTNC